MKKDRSFIQSLEKGLAVIRTFSQQSSEQTIAEVAAKAHISRAAARRVLLTLEQLGYVSQGARGEFSLRPSILSLGFSYLSALEFPEQARPYMQRVVSELGHSCSIAVLDGTEAVYVARVPGLRIVNVSLTIGSRYPAHVTALGRVLLANLDENDLEQCIKQITWKKWTDHTTLDRKRLLKEIEQVRKQGYSIIDQELQEGVWAVAAPIFDHRGRVKAAVNIAIHDPNMKLAAIKARELPALLRTAADISEATGMNRKN
jgi:IclR family pca regulon transcriptional regulator